MKISNLNLAINLVKDKTNYSIDQINEIKKITNGFTNSNFCFIFDDQKQYQVRLGANNDIVNRDNELMVFKTLKIHGIIYYDALTGNMIKEWINGEKINDWTVNKLILLVKELKKMHSISEIENIVKFDKFALLKKFPDEKLIYEFKILIVKYEKEKLVICHNDLNPTNILFNKKLNLIDFEFAKLNSIYWEIANFARESLTIEQIKFLAATYGNIDLIKLKDFLIMTTIYALMWTYSTNWTPTIEIYRKNTKKRLKIIRTYLF